jgi:hypothetical protein
MEEARRVGGVEKGCGGGLEGGGGVGLKKVWGGVE